jgi:hypothetical protein
LGRCFAGFHDHFSDDGRRFSRAVRELSASAAI